MKPIALIIALLLLTAGSAGALEICEVKVTVYQITGNLDELDFAAGWNGRITGEIGRWIVDRHPNYKINNAIPMFNYSKKQIKEMEEEGIRAYRFISIAEPTGDCLTK